VGYVKKNALAGHVFASWEALSAHLVRWQREVSDVRCHGTTAEAPRLRFERDERAALQPLAGKPPFAQARELQRVVSSEACVEVDTNRYSVPWRLIGESVSVLVEADSVVVRHGGQAVAHHALLSGQRQRAIEPAHFDGLVGRAFQPRTEGEAAPAVPAPPSAGACGAPVGGAGTAPRRL
jgi:hypothetical protein